MSEKYLTEFLTDQSIAIIKSHNHTKPLYLQISHAAVHTAKGGTADQEAGIMQVPDLRENDRTFAHIANPDRRLFAGLMVFFFYKCSAFSDCPPKIVTSRTMIGANAQTFRLNCDERR